jgi:hypothetical protein
MCVWFTHTYTPVQQKGVVSLQFSLEDAEFRDELSNYELHNEDFREVGCVLVGA